MCEGCNCSSTELRSYSQQDQLAIHQSCISIDLFGAAPRVPANQDKVFLFPSPAICWLFVAALNELLANKISVCDSTKQLP